MDGESGKSRKAISVKKKKKQKTKQNKTRETLNLIKTFLIISFKVENRMQWLVYQVKNKLIKMHSLFKSWQPLPILQFCARNPAQLASPVA